MKKWELNLRLARAEIGRRKEIIDAVVDREENGIKRQELIGKVQGLESAIEVIEFLLYEQKGEKKG